MIKIKPITKIDPDRIFSDALNTDIYMDRHRINDDITLTFEFYKNENTLKWTYDIGYEYHNDNYYVILDDTCVSLQDAMNEAMRIVNHRNFASMFRVSFGLDRARVEAHRRNIERYVKESLEYDLRLNRKAKEC